VLHSILIRFELKSLNMPLIASHNSVTEGIYKFNRTVLKLKF